MTVAIPLQLKHQWITIGWALEGAALSWLYRRIPHRGLLASAVARCCRSRSPGWRSTPRSSSTSPAACASSTGISTRIFCAPSRCCSPAWWLSKTDDRIASLPRASSVLPAGGVILLFLLLNIEIADFYATGPEITFRFGVTLAQDLTYTIGWLIFGLGLLTAGIYLHNRVGRIDRGRAHRRDDVQGVPLRHGIARRPVSRGIARRVWRSRSRWSRWRCRSSSCSRPPRRLREHRSGFTHGVAGARRRSALLQALATAQQPASPPAFRFERPVAANGPGPRRLAIDVPLLAGLKSDLGDLRLFDASGREIAHLLVSRPSGRARLETGGDSSGRPRSTATN